MLWCLATSSYVASYETTDQPPQGNLALFAVLFLVCCVEAVIVKVVSEEMRADSAAEATDQLARRIS